MVVVDGSQGFPEGLNICLFFFGHFLEKVEVVKVSFVARRWPMLRMIQFWVGCSPSGSGESSWQVADWISSSMVPEMASWAPQVLVSWTMYLGDSTVQDMIPKGKLHFDPILCRVACQSSRGAYQISRPWLLHENRFLIKLKHTKLG
jgi:hypothetical protein